MNMPLLRIEPAEHYDAAAEHIQNAKVEFMAPSTPTETYLAAIAESLQGLLRHQMKV